MNKIDYIKKLQQLDLNLLVILKAIDEHQHITRAAQSLGLSQSAISHALTRLRTTFADELFVKTPKGVVPTPKALMLIPKIDPILKSLGEVFFIEEKFSPAALKRNFQIKTTDLMEYLLLAPLLELQSEVAPGMQVSFRHIGFELPKDELADGSVDLAVAGFFGDLPSGFYKQKILTDSFQCAVRNDFPKASWSLEYYCKQKHLLIAPGGELSGVVDKALQKAKMSRPIVMGTSSFLAAGHALLESDVVLTAPSTLLQALAKRLPIRVFDTPLELPKINIVQVWHERVHNDPAHKWLREEIRFFFAKYL